MAIGPLFLQMLIVLLTGGIIDVMKMIEGNKQIFTYKNSKVEILKSFSLLKNISENFI